MNFRCTDLANIFKRCKRHTTFTTVWTVSEVRIEYLNGRKIPQNDSQLATLNFQAGDPAKHFVKGGGSR